MQGKYGFKYLRPILLTIALSIGMICAACRAPADAQQGGKLIAADFEMALKRLHSKEMPKTWRRI